MLLLELPSVFTFQASSFTIMYHPSLCIFAQTVLSACITPPHRLLGTLTQVLSSSQCRLPKGSPKGRDHVHVTSASPVASPEPAVDQVFHQYLLSVHDQSLGYMVKYE